MNSSYGDSVSPRVPFKTDTPQNGKDKIPPKEDSVPSIALEELLHLNSQKKFVEKLKSKNISVSKIKMIFLPY